MLQLVKGQVTEVIDKSGSGYFKAKFKDISTEPVTVILSSPGYKKGGGGLFFMPDIGDFIIAAYDDQESLAYYQGTLIQNVKPSSSIQNVKPSSSKGNIARTSNSNVGASIQDVKPSSSKGPIAKKSYSNVGAPIRTTYEDKFGQGLSITRNREETPPKINSSVDLTSEKNKKISLNDSPGIEAILIRNQHGEGIKIQGDANGNSPAGMISIESNGPQHYTCRNTYINMRLVDGKDINISNDSGGGMSTPVLTRPNAGFAALYPEDGAAGMTPKRYGGIYLRSAWGDVSMAAKGLTSRIFLSTPGGRIQIVSKPDATSPTGFSSDVRIESTGDISLKSAGNINISADKDVNISANNMNVKTLVNYVTESGGIASIKSAGSMTLDGTTIDLNSGLSVPAVIPRVFPTIYNDYYE